MNWSYVFYSFKLVELVIKVTPLIVKIDCGTKSFGKTLVLQSVFHLKVIKVFNTLLPLSYLYQWILCHVLLAFIGVFPQNETMRKLRMGKIKTDRKFWPTKNSIKSWIFCEVKVKIIKPKYLDLRLWKVIFSGFLSI